MTYTYLYDNVVIHLKHGRSMTGINIMQLWHLMIMQALDTSECMGNACGLTATLTEKLYYIYLCAYPASTCVRACHDCLYTQGWPKHINYEALYKLQLASRTHPLAEDL